MAFLSWNGLSNTNPYVGTDRAYIQLSHPAIADVLVLSHFQDDPYNRDRTGFKRSDGRSVTGSLKIKGNQYEALPEWRFNFLLKAEHIYLFDLFLDIQNSSPIAITLVDNFRYNDAHQIWIDVDNRYLTPKIGLSYWMLQFTAMKDI